MSDQLYSILLLVAFGSWFILAGYAAIYRYRRISNPTERQQTKWVIAGILGSFLAFIPFIIVTIWFPPSQPSSFRLWFMLLAYQPIYILSYLCIPAGVAFAILRYRLWDIDLIIRKTILYVVLSVLLATIFFGAVVLITSLFSSISGQQSSLSLVISTLIIAGLFSPLRRWLQDTIDRRFYRRKYNSERVINEFAAITRSETDLATIIDGLNSAVNETLQPEEVRFWLRK
jgi:hypothetical protein